MKPALHFNCATCGAHGNGNGPGAEDAILSTVNDHVQRGHLVRTWRRGDRMRATIHMRDEEVAS